MIRDQGVALISRRIEWWILAAVCAAAIALRLYNLAEWSLTGDEYWSWQDSEFLSWQEVRLRPLYYVLNHFVVMPVVGMRELGLRLVPFLAGVAAVPTVYLMCRRLNLRLVGLATAALLAASTWHLYWSQFARYYTLVFLFTAVSGLSLIGWIRQRESIWAWTAIGSGLLAVLSHPSALFVVGSQAAVAALYLIRSGFHKVKLVSLAVAAVILAVGVVHYAPILIQWMQNVESACCHTGAALLLSLTNWMTAPIMVFALIGMFTWAFASDDKAAGRIITAGALVPTAVFAILSNFGAISLSYLFTTAPFYLLAAGWLAARIGRLHGSMTAQRVQLTATVLALMGANLVGVASHFRDGGRLPHRQAAFALKSIVGEGDRLIVEGTGIYDFYAHELKTIEMPYDSLELREMVEQAPRTWVLAPHLDRAGYGYYERQFAAIYQWLDDSCDVINEFGTPRLDFRQNTLRLFACSQTP